MVGWMGGAGLRGEGQKLPGGRGREAGQASRRRDGQLSDWKLTYAAFASHSLAHCTHSPPAVSHPITH